ncbi:MAG: type II toxin-antitoxin system HicA family toxin [Chloroflexi bacterium]|nr:type II toxin-antitoxin system HicA family toxin [Chloroflexota bacterium]
MPKLRRLSGKEVCNILVLNGFDQIRQRGSHIVMQKKYLKVSGEEGTTTVSVPNHKELRLGTLSGIIRRSGLPRELFE